MGHDTHLCHVLHGLEPNQTPAQMRAYVRRSPTWRSFVPAAHLTHVRSQPQACVQFVIHTRRPRTLNTAVSLIVTPNNINILHVMQFVSLFKVAPRLWSTVRQPTVQSSPGHLGTCGRASTAQQSVPLSPRIISIPKLLLCISPYSRSSYSLRLRTSHRTAFLGPTLSAFSRI